MQVKLALAVSALMIAACSDQPIIEPIRQDSKIVAQSRYESDGITYDIRVNGSVTTVVAFTDRGSGPEILYVQRKLPSGVSELSYVSEGRMVSKTTLANGTVVNSKLHAGISAGNCGAKWADANNPAGHAVGSCDVGDVTPNMTCIPTEDYSCGGGGPGEDDADCECASLRDTMNSALEDYFWATGMMALSCISPQPLEPLACGIATLYAARKLTQYQSAKYAYDACKSTKASDPRCRPIAYGKPWPTKERFA